MSRTGSRVAAERAHRIARRRRSTTCPTSKTLICHRRRHRQRERVRERAAAQRDPALRDRAVGILRARRSRRLALRPGRARVHAHPPPRHDVGACRPSTTGSSARRGRRTRSCRAGSSRASRSTRSPSARPAAATAARGSTSSSGSRATSGKDLRLDEVTGAPRQFPRGNAAYIYGSHFLQLRLRSLRRRHAARDVAHLRRVRAAVRGQPPDREGRRQAVHRAVRRLEAATCATSTACRRWRPSGAASRPAAR